MHKMFEKRERMAAGAPENPFIDPDGYHRFVRAEEAKFVAQIQRERGDL